MVIGQWVSLLLMYARKLQTLQLDMAEFACLSTILLFTQGKDTILSHCLNWDQRSVENYVLLSEVISQVDGKIL